LTYGKSGGLLPTSGLTSHQSDLEVVMVAVHDQGRLDDNRPHYLMKLVEGQTLGEALHSRPAPEDGLMGWLEAFSQAWCTAT
jgi:hypothetical protein